MKSMLIASTLMICADAAAQMKGDNLFQAGVLYVETLDRSEPLQTRLRPSLLGDALGIEEAFTSPGTSASVGSTSTLALTYTRFVTDHLGLKFAGGIPARFEVSGRGSVAPTGIGGTLFKVELGDPSFNPLATSKQWSPALLLEYYFGDPDAVFRPFIGLGVTYTWFTDEELNEAFRDELNQQFGTVLALAAGKPGPTTTRASGSSSWAPIVGAGLSYAFSERWGIAVSVSYAAISTTASIDIDAADGTRLSRSQSDLDVNPLSATAFVSYTR